MSKSKSKKGRKRSKIKQRNSKNARKGTARKGEYAYSRLVSSARGMWHRDQGNEKKSEEGDKRN